MNPPMNRRGKLIVRMTLLALALGLTASVGMWKALGSGYVQQRGLYGAAKEVLLTSGFFTPTLGNRPNAAVNPGGNATIAQAAAPTLGNYAGKTVTLGGNVTITPSAAPTGATSISVASGTDFKGTFAANLVTGEVRVINAHPAGAYTVMVKAFGTGGEVTRLFPLSVENTVLCSGVSTFTGSLNIPVYSPNAVVVGDFNGDGKQDLAISRGTMASVSVYLGDGQGGFTRSTEISINSVRSMAVGDFNGDGKQDMVVAKREANTVMILLGDGGGLFNTTPEVSVGTWPYSVAVGDFNGDGKQDIATANTGSDNVSIRLGDGAGGLLVASTYPDVAVGHNPRSVIVADFDDDGKQDLATANTGSGTVSILMGKNGGGFQDTTPIFSGINPLALVVGDFNYNLRQDLAVANQYPLNNNVSPQGTISILMGNYQGGFFPKTTFDVNREPSSVALGDFNNDGIQDLAVTDDFFANVSICQGDGNGGFPIITQLFVAAGPRSVAVGDFNGDGKQDLAVANYLADNVSIRLGVCCTAITLTPATLTGATTGALYNANIAASGGTPNYTFQIANGALPTGLTLANNGTLSGVPTALGTYNFTVRATDAKGCMGSQSYSLTITCPTIAITPSTLPAGTTGTTYSSSLTASGGTPAYTFAVTSGSLPTGLTLTSNGTLSGVPTAAGTYNFTVGVTDANGCMSSQSYNLTITCPTIAITPSTLPGGTTGTTYSSNLTASGGTSAYTFTVTSGSLPTGLTLASNGTLSGVPTAAGTYNFTVKATDAYGCIGSQSYILTITCPTITINPASLPDGTIGGVLGMTYSSSLTASGGTSAYTFTVVSGSLPPGLTLASNGTLSGVPTALGTYNFTVGVTDANGCTGSRSYSLTIICPTITVTPFSLSGGTIGNTYSSSFGVLFGTSTYTFTVISGSLPAGLTLATDGTLSGVPTAAGTYNFTVRARDANGCTGSQSYNLTITCPTITVNPATLLGGTVGTVYNQTITTSGSLGSFTFSYTGNLPPGVTLSATTGALSGTPTGAGNFNFTVTATSTYGCSGNRSYSVTIIPLNTPPQITAGSSFTRQQSSPAGAAVTIATVNDAETAAGLLTITATSVPTGITLGSITNTGGTITAAIAAACGATAGANSITLRVADPQGLTATASFTVNITANSAPNLSYTNQTVMTGDGLSISPATAADNGSITSYTLISPGTYTGGIAVNSSTGVVTISDAKPGGLHSITIRATDNCGATTNATIALTVACPTIAVAPDTLPIAVTGVAYTTSITASGGTLDYTFNITSGSLPPGLTLNSNGAWSGAPTTTGSYNFTVTATDANGCSGSRAYTLNITAPPTLGNYSNTTISLGANSVITPSTAPTNTISVSVATSTGFKGTFVGDPVTGEVRVINAQPASVYTVTVKAFEYGAVASKTFTLTVQNGLLCGSPAFTNTADVGVGSNPVSVAVGDFNGDGKQDLAVANFNSNSVSIRLGNGQGGFSGTTNVSVGSAPYSVAAGDFNGDGKQDLAVANATSNSVSIRLGDGQGNFSGTTDVGVGSAPISVAVGDFNGDGKQDLAVANFDSHSVSIRLGDGQGNFSGTTDIGVGNNPRFVAVGDFNGDGKQDLVTALYDSFIVSIRLGDGQGNFSAATNVVVGSNPHSVAVGDFNGDGKQDLAVANFSSNRVSIRLGDGQGNFSGTTDIIVGSGPFFVAVGDFNGDGKQDLANTNYSSNSVSIRLGGCANSLPLITAAAPLNRQQSSQAGAAVTLATVSDAETAAGSLTVTATSVPAGITLGPITNTNGTITATIAAACDATVGANSITLRVTDAQGATATASLTVNVTANLAPALSYTNLSALLNGAANINPTTATDNGNIASYGLVSQGTYTGTITINSSTGEVSVSNAKPVGPHSITIRATDNCGATTNTTFTLTVNCPTITLTPDTLPNSQPGLGYSQRVTASGGASPYLYSYTGTLPTGLVFNDGFITGLTSVNGTFNFTVTATDVNGCTGSRAYTITVLPALALGSYSTQIVAPGANLTVNPSAAPVSADEIAVAVSPVEDSAPASPFQGTVVVDPATGVVRIVNAYPAGSYDVSVRAFGNGAEVVTSFRLTAQTGESCSKSILFSNASNVSTGFNPRSVAVGDFNQDGNQDLAVANEYSNSIWILLRNGNGGFTAATPVNVGDGPQSVAVGDFNGDGKQDLAVANMNSNNVSILLGNGNGGFSPTTSVDVGGSPRSVAVGDFNGDGKQDLAVAKSSSTNVSILLGNGNGGFSLPGDINVGSAPQFVLVSDFDGNGIQDLAVVNSGSNTISIRLGNGSGGFTGTTDISVGSNPQAVAVGDFNGNGVQDLAVTNWGSNTVSILLGNGQGGFSLLAGIPTSSNPQSVVVGDFNRDGKHDLAIANAGANKVSILLGNGNGAFTGTTETGVGSNPSAIAVGDFNGDGKLDLAVANSNQNFVSIRLGACLSAPPTIVAGNALTRRQGSLAISAQVATVSDPEQAANTLQVKVTGATAPGVTVDGFSIDSSGVVTANVAAGCSATNSNITLEVTDYEGLTATAMLTVNVTSNGIPIVRYDNQTALLGAGLSFMPSVAIDDGSITYSLVDKGNYKGGIVVNSSTGRVTLSNAQPLGGPFAITIRALDSCGAGGDVPPFAVYVDCAPIVISPAIPALGTFGSSYNQALTPSGGIGPYTFTLLSGTLPIGITLNSTTGVLSGTPVQAGIFNFSLLVKDAYGCDVIKSFTLTINDYPRIFIQGTFTLNQGTLAGQPVTIATVSDLETPAGNLVVKATSVPTGIKLEQITNNNGTITATLGAVCGAPIGAKTITLEVTDAQGAISSKGFEGNVGANTPPNFSYSNQTAQPGGGLVINPTTATDNGSITSFSLLSQGTYTGGIAVNNSTGVVTISNAMSPGSHTITIRATDNCGLITDASFTLTTCQPPAITAQPASQTVCAGDSVTFSVAATGDGLSYQWRKGTVDIANATASSFTIPTAATSNAGSYTVVVTGTCGAVTSSAATLTVNLTTAITTQPASQNKLVSQSVTFSVAATGTNLNYQWRKGGAPISGATASSYTISAVSLADAGNYDVMVNGTCGSVTSAIATLTVTCPAIMLSSATLPGGTMGLAYSQTITASGGTANYAFTVTGGSLPPGLTLNSDGTWSGAPTGSGSFNFTVTATDANNCSGSRAYTLTINAPPQINAGGPFTRQQGSPAGAAAAIATVSDIETSAGSLAVTATSVPAGVTLGPISNSNGTITATIAAACGATAGANSITLKVTDPQGATAFADVTVNVTANSPPLLGTYPATTLSLGTGGTITPTSAPSDNVSITGITASAPGFTGTFLVNSSTGVITVAGAGGIGAFNVTVTAYDNCGARTTRSFTLTVTGAACAFLDFGAAVNFAAGTGPKAVAMGDFNRDGKTDLVTTNAGTNNVSVLIGNGTGGFGAAANFNVGASPSAVAIGDFNIDGKVDLAVANNGSGTVSVLPGNGSGGFGAATDFDIGSNPSAVAVGDFNGDGWDDLAVANYGSNSVSLLIGNGKGGFTPAVNFNLGTNPNAVAAGDFNGDGKLDLVTANSGSNNVSVLMGDGASGFAAAVNFPAGTNPASVAVSDFNLDGRLDLATANYGSNNVSVLLGNGAGGFGAAVNRMVGTNPTSVTAADLNLDGKPDLAAANHATNNVSVLAGDGQGGFAAAVNFAVGTNPSAIAAGDFNLDGKADVVAVNMTSNNVSAMLSTCPSDTAPKIKPGATVTRQQGSSAGVAVTIASVNDNETPKGSLVVTATTVPNGIVIDPITNTNGAITATVAATCAAAVGANNVTLTVSDGVYTATAVFTVNVTANAAPALGKYGNVNVNIGGGVVITPSVPPTDNGSIANLTAVAPGFTGTLSANPTTGVVTVSNAGPEGRYNVVVTATDNCGAQTNASFTLTVKK